MNKTKDTAKHYRVSDVAERILEEMAEIYGINKTAMVEVLIRRAADANQPNYTADTIEKIKKEKEAERRRVAKEEAEAKRQASFDACDGHAMVVYGEPSLYDYDAHIYRQSVQCSKCGYCDSVIVDAPKETTNETA